MPKHDFFSPKAIGNRIKSIGLQKLRWYCQMCQKQCRDENGFKCHLSSDSHLRQMRVFSENPSNFIDDFSKEFERGYLEILNHRHGSKRVKANTVYQEYIGDKAHIHMNATIWTTLATFVKYLGKEGKAVVDETEKGWFIQYIDRDPKVIARQALNEQRQQAELDEEQRHNKIIEAQILAAEKSLTKDRSDLDIMDNETKTNHELCIDENREKIALSLTSSFMPNKKARIVGGNLEVFKSFDNAAKDVFTSNKSSTGTSSSGGGLSALDQIMGQEETRKLQMIKIEDAKSRKDYWLHEGIVVKVLNKKLSQGKFYKQKGVVTNVIDQYVGDVQLLDGSVVRFDQNDLETVIPKEGGKVLVVNGVGRGFVGTLLRINEDKFCCDVRIEEGHLNKTEIIANYEDISKLS